MNSNCSNLLAMRNLQEQVKKAFCYQKLFWPFTVWKNCCSDLKKFPNSRRSASNFKIFSWSLKQFFLKIGQNKIGNKIPCSHGKPSKSFACELKTIKHLMTEWTDHFVTQDRINSSRRTKIRSRSCDGMCQQTKNEISM